MIKMLKCFIHVMPLLLLSSYCYGYALFKDIDIPLKNKGLTFTQETKDKTKSLQHVSYKHPDYILNVTYKNTEFKEITAFAINIKVDRYSSSRDYLWQLIRKLNNQYGHLNSQDSGNQVDHYFKYLEKKWKRNQLPFQNDIMAILKEQNSRKTNYLYQGFALNMMYSLYYKKSDVPWINFKFNYLR